MSEQPPQLSWPLVQYRIELIMTGIAGIAIPVLHILELQFGLAIYSVLVFVALTELIFGLQFSLWNLSALPFKALLKHLHPTGKVPPNIVLTINAVIMLCLACAGIAMSLWLPEWCWLPATLIGTFALLAGTTGICPVALTYALLTRNRLQSNCIPDK